MRHIYNWADLPKTQAHVSWQMITGAEHMQHEEAIHMETRSSQKHTGTWDAETCHLITRQAYHNVQPLFEASVRVTSFPSADQTERSSL